MMRTAAAVDAAIRAAFPDASFSVHNEREPGTRLWKGYRVSARNIYAQIAEVLPSLGLTLVSRDDFAHSLLVHIDS